MTKQVEQLGNVFTENISFGPLNGFAPLYAHETLNTLLPRDQPRSEAIVEMAQERRPDWIQIYNETNEYIKNLTEQSMYKC